MFVAVLDCHASGVGDSVFDTVDDHPIIGGCSTVADTMLESSNGVMA